MSVNCHSKLFPLLLLNRFNICNFSRNILSVEEYIKESLFLETSANKSLYRSLRLDTESVEIKRIMDEQVVRSAAILKEAVRQDPTLGQILCNLSLIFNSKRCPLVKPSWRSDS